MAIVFRPLEERDGLKVLSLFQKLGQEMAEVSFTEIADKDPIEEWMNSEDNFVFVAADGDVILAVVRAKRENSNPQAALLTVAVDYNFRGQSLAKNLTLHCLNAIKEKDIRIVRAYIYSNNYASVCTILSCGFVAAGSVHQHHYDERHERYVDDLIFHKVLGQ